MSLLVGQRDLLQRYRAGDRSALEQVYRHYAADVARFLSRGFAFRTGDRELVFTGFKQPFDLDNALQETFARAFKESARLAYDGLNPFKNYLLAIARNLVMDEFRNREVAMSPFIEARARDDRDERESGDGRVAAAWDGDESGEAPEHDYLHQELARLYAAFVERLDERDRMFFRARFEEQGTQIEAGERVGLSHMQARSAEKRLRERFLKFMQANGYLEQYGAPSGRSASPTTRLA